MGLPIEQYPNIVPPTIKMQATYPGAHAEDVYKRQVFHFKPESRPLTMKQEPGILAVSYTHLDVYKRQDVLWPVEGNGRRRHHHQLRLQLGQAAGANHSLGDGNH